MFPGMDLASGKRSLKTRNFTSMVGGLVIFATSGGV
jgi:hypothetical protein